jgi:malonyl-CoA decarboxylase
MPGFLTDYLKPIQGRRRDMRFLCRSLLSESGEASQTAIAQEIIATYNSMKPEQRLSFFELLSREFGPDEAAIRRAVAEYEKAPGTKTLDVLSAAVEAPRQELMRRINTAPGGTETLVTMREHLLSLPPGSGDFSAIDSDLKHLFRSWFNRGFLQLRRISWETSALILEKLIHYEAVHEINGWPDLRRRLESDRRCFAFFHPALPDEPLVFVEVALMKGLPGNLAPLLDINAPVLPVEQADTAVFYSINNCLKGLRGVPFGNFLIKQVVAELAAELPNITTYSTLSPMPLFSQGLRDAKNESGFTPERLSRLLAKYARSLTSATRLADPVAAFFKLLEDPAAHREVLAEPLQRVAFAYLTRLRKGKKLYDPVATFHLANGARLERVNVFGSMRPYGLKESFGVTVNYRYLPDELEENHERFVNDGQIRVPKTLLQESKIVDEAWGIAENKSSQPVVVGAVS